MNCYKIKELIDEIEYFHEEYEQPLETMTDMLVDYYLKTNTYVNNQMISMIREYEEKNKSTPKTPKKNEAGI